VKCSYSTAATEGAHVEDSPARLESGRKLGTPAKQIRAFRFD
jgi:hypothetical protein